MDVVRIDSRHVEKASFAQRLLRLRLAFKNGRVTDYYGVPPGLFTALANARDPEQFLSTRIQGKYVARDVNTTQGRDPGVESEADIEPKVANSTKSR